MPSHIELKFGGAIGHEFAILIATVTVLALSCLSQSLAKNTIAPAPPEEVKLTRDLAAVRSFALTTGDQLWPGYGTALFGMLLLFSNREVLVCQGSLPKGFIPTGPDPATGCDRSVRKRSNLAGDLLATFPAFGPLETIVMGTPLRAGRTHGDWVQTILHEHFHQWQTSQRGYSARVEALDLSGGDKSGMWMLNFPVPYGSPLLQAAYARTAPLLARAIQAIGTDGFRSALQTYLVARREFENAAGPKNWRYIEFQLWQEGVARWTEITLGSGYPDPEVRNAADFLRMKGIEDLLKPDLTASGRVFVYPFGAAETMLIEQCDPSWRTKYSAMLSLSPLLKIAVTRCGLRE